MKNQDEEQQNSQQTTKQELPGYFSKMSELIEELHTYSEQKKLFLDALDAAQQDYITKKLSHEKYHQLIQHILKGRTKTDIIKYYDSYIFFLLKQIEFMNSKIFYFYYTNTSYLDAGQKKEEHKATAEAEKKAPAKKAAPAPKVSLQKPALKKELPEAKQGKSVPPHTEIQAAIDRAKSPEMGEKETKPAINIFKAIKEFFSNPFKKLRLEKHRKAAAESIQTKPAHPPKLILPEKAAAQKTISFDTTAERPGAEKKTEEQKQLASIEAQKTTEIPAQSPPPAAEKLRLKEPAKEYQFSKENEPVKMQGIFSTIFNWLKKRADALQEKKQKEKKDKQQKEEEQMRLIGSKTEIAPTIMGLTQGEPALLVEEDESRINPYLLAQEAKRIKKILQKEQELNVYRPSSIGTIANHLSRKTSLFLLDQFPDFFRSLYNALRSADMKILSNTYLNIMILCSTLSIFASFAVYLFMFFFMNTPLIMVLLNSFFFAVLTGLAVFVFMFAYPFMRIRTRRRSINTNLPFAINHMSAVVGAGVPPDGMFRLLSQSKEYEEISREVEKIAEYIDVFGYDLLTAIKSVAATTPSEPFKEFLDGMTSAIETGGDIKEFLKQKSDEAMLSYTLEREKYLETISSYSDIYTGILIAAPLFFVVALTLVNVLGGTVGGIDVNVLITVGIYLLIPLLNILFLIFLEASQPEA